MSLDFLSFEINTYIHTEMPAASKEHLTPTPWGWGRRGGCTRTEMQRCGDRDAGHSLPKKVFNPQPTTQQSAADTPRRRREFPHRRTRSSPFQQSCAGGRTSRSPEHPHVSHTAVTSRSGRMRRHHPWTARSLRASPMVDCFPLKL